MWFETMEQLKSLSAFPFRQNVVFNSGIGLDKSCFILFPTCSQSPCPRGNMYSVFLIVFFEPAGAHARQVAPTGIQDERCFGVTFSRCLATTSGRTQHSPRT